MILGKPSRETLMKRSSLFHPNAVIAIFLAFSPVSGFTAGSGFKQAVMGDEPVLYWQLGESEGNIINHGSYGNTHDATVIGAPGRAVPTLSSDTGIEFTSVDDYLESLGTAPEELTGNPTFTTEAVFFIPLDGEAEQYGPLLHWGNSGTSNSVYFSFHYNTPHEIYAGFYNGGLSSPAQSVPLGEWHHVMWIRSGGGLPNEGTTVYIDGVDVTSQLIPDPVLCCNFNTPSVAASEFRVNRTRDFIGQRHFTGILDELVLYDKALTAEQVQEHWTLIRNEIFADSFETP